MRGHRRTYIGAFPGQIIQMMKKAGTVNPVFLLDEVDKLGADFRGDPASALLEVLDPEQNHAFVDHYLDVEYDLSKVFFIATANVTHTIPPALQRPHGDDPPLRLHPLREAADRPAVPGPQADRAAGPGRRSRSRFADEAMHAAHRALHPRGGRAQPGARDLLGAAASWRARCSKAKTARGTEIDGHPGRGPRAPRQAALPPAPGRRAKPRSAWPPGWPGPRSAASILSTEVSLMRGKGHAHAHRPARRRDAGVGARRALYVRARAAHLPMPAEFFEQHDIHVHVPEGAIPKDGPSAGITMATALLSAVTGVPVRQDLAMTGEITLRGKVLPVGGIKDKMLAAYRAGIREVILPVENEKDLEDIPEDVRSVMQFHLVKEMDEVDRPGPDRAAADGEQPVGGGWRHGTPAARQVAHQSTHATSKASTLRATVADHRKGPRDPFPQVAFAGRSNVGKSSLLNTLLGTTLAAVSKQPGKTRTINYYLVNQTVLLRRPAGLRLRQARTGGAGRVGRADHRPTSVQEPRLTLVVGLVDPRHPDLAAGRGPGAVRAAAGTSACWSCSPRPTSSGAGALGATARAERGSCATSSWKRRSPSPPRPSPAMAAGRDLDGHPQTLGAMTDDPATRSLTWLKRSATRPRSWPPQGAMPNPEGLPVVLDEETLEAEATTTEGKQRLDMRTLKDMIDRATSRRSARDLEVENPAGMRKQDLIFKILQAQTEREGLIFGEGVLEILPDGFGFLRAPEYNYLPGPRRHLRLAVADPPLQPAHRRHGLRPDPPAARRASATSPCSRSRRSTSSRPTCRQEKILFDNLTPLYPQERINLEIDPSNTRPRGSWTCSTPIGKGQRGLIVAPPRTGKTMLLQKIANAITTNHPEVDPHRAAHRRAARGGHRHAALGQGRGDLLDLRRAGRPPRAGRRDGAREGQAPGRAPAATW